MSRSSKFFLGFVVHTFTLGIVCFALAFWWASSEFAKPGPLAQTAMFEVESGDSLMAIAKGLKDSGAVENPYIFVFGTRVSGAQSKLKAGEYEIAAGASPREIMRKIRDGDVVERRVTVREGLTSYEVVEIVKGVKDLDGETGVIPQEGSLLPQTYDYKMHEPREAVLTRMRESMTKTMEELWPKRSNNLPFSTEREALTLASIVEKETGVPGERARIAGVFINRLRRGIPLQTDPTVIYALTNGRPQNEGHGPLGRRLLTKDLEVDSPYNTYKNAGLPPGPIANPGREAIEATLNPEEHNYIYFVADGTGGHVFAATLEEHNANVVKWREIRKEQGN